MNIFKRKPDIKKLSALLSYGLFVDVESAGLDPQVNGILSVGACALDGGEYYGECHLYSHQKAEKAALKINGLKEEDIIYKAGHDLDSPHEMVRKFVEWSRKCLRKEAPIGYIIGKNPRWDYEMLKAPWDNVFAKDGPNPEPFPFSHRVIDLTSIAALAYLKDGREIPAGGISSGELQKYLKMDNEPSPHNALTGAKYNREMLLKLLEKI